MDHRDKKRPNNGVLVVDLLTPPGDHDLSYEMPDDGGTYKAFCMSSARKFKKLVSALCMTDMFDDIRKCSDIPDTNTDIFLPHEFMFHSMGAEEFISAFVSIFYPFFFETRVCWMDVISLPFFKYMVDWLYRVDNGLGAYTYNFEKAVWKQLESCVADGQCHHVLLAVLGMNGVFNRKSKLAQIVGDITSHPFKKICCLSNGDCIFTMSKTIDILSYGKEIATFVTDNAFAFIETGTVPDVTPPSESSIRLIANLSSNIQKSVDAFTSNMCCIKRYLFANPNAGWLTEAMCRFIRYAEVLGVLSAWTSKTVDIDLFVIKAQLRANTKKSPQPFDAEMFRFINAHTTTLNPKLADKAVEVLRAVSALRVSWPELVVGFLDMPGQPLDAIAFECIGHPYTRQLFEFFLASIKAVDDCSTRCYKFLNKFNYELFTNCLEGDELVDAIKAKQHGEHSILLDVSRIQYLAREHQPFLISLFCDITLEYLRTRWRRLCVYKSSRYTEKQLAYAEIVNIINTEIPGFKEALCNSVLSSNVQPDTDYLKLVYSMWNYKPRFTDAQCETLLRRGVSIVALMHKQSGVAKVVNELVAKSDVHISLCNIYENAYTRHVYRELFNETACIDDQLVFLTDATIKKLDCPFQLLPVCPLYLTTTGFLPLHGIEFTKCDEWSPNVSDVERLVQTRAKLNPVRSRMCVPIKIPPTYLEKLFECDSTRVFSSVTRESRFKYNEDGSINWACFCLENLLVFLLDTNNAEEIKAVSMKLCTLVRPSALLIKLGLVMTGQTQYLKRRRTKFIWFTHKEISKMKFAHVRSLIGRTVGVNF